MGQFTQKKHEEVGESGDITTAISGAITAAIGTDGAIETWGDGRYEPKASQE